MGEFRALHGNSFIGGPSPASSVCTRAFGIPRENARVQERVQKPGSPTRQMRRVN